MSIRQDRTWKLKYTPDHGDLTKLLYQPILASAVRYDRADWLLLHLRTRARGARYRGPGAEWRPDADGGGLTLHQPEIEAIERGEELRAQVVDQIDIGGVRSFKREHQTPIAR
jgi:hypothetical protein